MIMSLKQRKIKFEPRIKLNHNIYIIIFNRSHDSVNDNRAHSHPTVHCICHKTKKKSLWMPID